MATAGKKKGPWKNNDASTFKEYQDAIKELLNQQPPGSTWMVEVEVKRVGNPIHDYRIVLSPTG
jgi:hypothetical protein